MNFSSDDQSCLTQPSNIVTCENVCFINRTEYLDTGKFYSLSRGCSNIWSTVSEVEGFKHIIKICNSELCNDGDGNLSTSINSTTEGTTGDTGSSISAIAPAVLICFSITMMAVHSY
ncbi:hypothetical protein C0J52_12287 [Blattella germanica]|nr:hypothetical protein C0J52_12287 [Blattella germanica]